MRKQAVVVMRSEAAVSERRACGLIGLYRGTYRYRGGRSDDGQLRQRLRELAHQFRRYGYRRLHDRLVRQGWRVNHKRICRLYRLEGLQVRKRRRKRCAGVPRVPLPAPTAANQVWSLDFMADTLSSGRKLRTRWRVTRIREGKSK
jgi:putative transposase